MQSQTYQHAIWSADRGSKPKMASNFITWIFQICTFSYWNISFPIAMEASTIDIYWASSTPQTLKKKMEYHRPHSISIPASQLWCIYRLLHFDEWQTKTLTLSFCRKTKRFFFITDVEVLWCGRMKSIFHAGQRTFYSLIFHSDVSLSKGVSSVFFYSHSFVSGFL